MQRYNFNKLLNARHKAHKKRMNYLEKYDTVSASKITNKIDNLSQIIVNHINNL